MITAGDTVVCAAAGTERDATLVGVGAALAERTGRDLDVLHVISAGGTGTTGARAIERPMVSGPGDARETARRWLAELAAGVGHDDAGCEIVEGAPLMVLAERSQRSRTGWLVVGDHGGGALRTAALGSVTRSLLTDAACPLLIVPDHASADAITATGTVLCAIDDDEAAAAATAAVAGALAADTGAALTLVHIFNEPAERSRRVDGGRRIGRLLSRCLSVVPVAVEVRRLVLAGAPTRRIVEVAESDGARIVVVGRPRHGPMLSALGGSVAHGLLAALADRLAVVVATE